MHISILVQVKVDYVPFYIFCFEYFKFFITFFKKWVGTNLLKDAEKYNTVCSAEALQIQGLQRLCWIDNLYTVFTSVFIIIYCSSVCCLCIVCVCALANTVGLFAILTSETTAQRHKCESEIHAKFWLILNARVPELHKTKANISKNKMEITKSWSWCEQKRHF